MEDFLNSAKVELLVVVWFLLVVGLGILGRGQGRGGFLFTLIRVKNRKKKGEKLVV